MARAVAGNVARPSLLKALRVPENVHAGQRCCVRRVGRTLGQQGIMQRQRAAPT